MRIALLASLTLTAFACSKEPPPVATPPAQIAAQTRAEPAPEPARPAPAAAELPPGHPPTGMPAGHPPTGGMPPGHPPTGGMPPGHPPTGGMAPGHPPMPAGGPMMAQVPAEEGVERPLPLEGSGSIAELKARLAKIADAARHAPLEDAFRKVFTVRRDLRDVRGAEVTLTPLAQDPDPAVAALAERTLGYVRVSSGFDQEGAKARYLRALELDADYGEAHYAMAFMLAMGNREAGRMHFDKAMALGVPDTRKLKDQFYGATP